MTAALRCRFRVCLALALLLCAVPRAMAVDLRNVLTGYTSASWSRKDGLIGPVWAIAQDANGFLWLGTDTGLVRFDGVRFASWEILGGQPLPRLPIRALAVTPEGSLWVGFGGTGGVARIDNRTVTTYVDAAHPGFVGVVTAIATSPSGAVWVSSTNGVVRYASGRWERLGAGDGLPGDGPASAFVDRDDRLWVSTPTGLFRRDTSASGVFSRVEPSRDPLRTLSLSQDGNGRIWATDSLEGFRLLTSGSALRSGESGRGYRLLHGRDGHLWVATIGQGLWRVSESPSGRGALIVERSTVLSGLSSDAVRTVFEDRDGNIWAGTTEGVDRLAPQRVTPWADLGLVNTLDATPDGQVWAGTADGLIPFVGKDANSRAIGTRLPIRGAIAVRGASTGTLWAATIGALYRVQGRTVIQIPAPQTTPPSSIEALTTDADGNAWLVVSSGDIFRTDGSALQHVAHIPQLGNSRTSNALLDRSGQLWLLYAGNRVGILAPDLTFRPFDDAALGGGALNDIHEDDNGGIWIGGVNGLGRLSGDHFSSVGMTNGLPAGGVYSIAQDVRGDFWLATASGIVRLDAEEFDRAIADREYLMRLHIYDTSDGLAGYPVTLADSHAVRAGDGTLWFVTSRGISVVDPRRLTPQRLAPLVAIDAARADDRGVTGNEIPPGTSKLEIAYTAPELTSPLKTRFRYRLAGFDADWIDAGTRREALYTGLAPGDYTFRVAVKQDDGRWSETEATWSFVLHPRFYQTWWFGGLVAMALAGATFGAWQIRVRQLRRQFALVLGERVRLSRELHDTLLQSLVGVALEFDAVSKSLESSPAAARDRVIRIREQVEEYIREARRSIWSLRSPALETGDIVEALRESGTRATAGHPVSFSFEQTGERHRLSANIEHQLLRIGHEALLNAVRHSGGSTITMRLHYEPESVTLSISDDGCGFEAGRIQEGTTDHYGLVTMRERAQQAGGTLTVISKPGQGTSVEAHMPTHADDDSHTGEGD